MQAEKRMPGAQAGRGRGVWRWLVPAVLLLAGTVWVLTVPLLTKTPFPRWAAALLRVESVFDRYRQDHDGREARTWPELQASIPRSWVDGVEKDLRAESRYQIMPPEAPVKVQGLRLLLMARGTGDEGDARGEPGRRVIAQNEYTGSLEVLRVPESTLQADFARQGKNLADWTRPMPRLPARRELPPWLTRAWQGWALLLLGTGLAVKNVLEANRR